VRLEVVGKLLGVFSAFLGVMLLLPLLVDILYAEGSFEIWLLSAVITLAVGLLLLLLSRGPMLSVSHREALAFVFLAWLVASVFGGLPYLFGGVFGSHWTVETWVEAVFEASSGFTTTGATVIVDVEAVSKGLLFWRSFTHWLGGMGIILLTLAVLPLLGVGGMQLFKAEVPGPTTDKLFPRIVDTAKALWLIYLSFTLAQTSLLWLAGLDLFEAICHTFGTMATGGFSTRNQSIGYYGSPVVDLIVISFMILAGTNFSLHFQMFRGAPGGFLRNTEFKVYFCIVGVLPLLIGFRLYLHGLVPSLGSAMRQAYFQVVSITTTTGFATADYEQWPFLEQMILFLLMFIGGSAGSTSGGMKVIRVVLLAKLAYRGIYRVIHPRAFWQVKLGGRKIPAEVLDSVTGFYLLYTSIFLAGSIFLSWRGLDFVTSCSALAATLGNVGPGLGLVGPTETYQPFPTEVKAFLVLCMILGRLEIYTVLCIFMPVFWRR